MGISEGCFIFDFASLHLEVAWPIYPTMCTKVAVKHRSSIHLKYYTAVLSGDIRMRQTPQSTSTHTEPAPPTTLIIKIIFFLYCDNPVSQSYVKYLGYCLFVCLFSVYHSIIQSRKSALLFRRTFSESMISWLITKLDSFREYWCYRSFVIIIITIIIIIIISIIIIIIICTSLL